MTIDLRPTIPAALFLLGCSGTGQPEVAYAAEATVAIPAALTAGEWTVTLDKASFAFGPVTFCASASGSATLCETALSELRTVTRVDALDPAAQPLGEVVGFAGAIRSASYDYGVHWFKTESSPTPDPAAPGGRSAHFAGVATRGQDVVRFVADVDALAQYRGQRAVPTAPVSADVGEGGARLQIRFDPGAWIAGVDFDRALATGEDPYVVSEASPDHAALVQGMVSTRPPEFVWSAP